MKYVGFFSGGPSAPWAEDDLRLSPEQEAEEQTAAVADRLARDLEARARCLRAHPTLQNVMTELRLQVAEATALDRMDRVSELMETILSLIQPSLRPDLSEPVPNTLVSSTLREAWPEEETDSSDL